ncbi:cell wall synthase accessory phosphoprotein MacP [Streptococcus merionis]|uniref:Membrane protein n=1 Tax=Streptococcus merionis TaxID=400065 RepID=A0A239SPB7_9STRE|nr:cell wall synthase accessory phosphoprotein MacP [Streptococcus merionis]SNU86574.1 membrane protein [Streptococcus merionis]
MGKPLLTDDIIRRAGRGEDYADWSADDQETKEIHFDRRDLERLRQEQQNVDETMPIHVEPSVIKSRRIENEKRSLFQSKLNLILLVLILLGTALVFAIFYL